MQDRFEATVSVPFITVTAAVLLSFEKESKRMVATGVLNVRVSPSEKPASTILSRAVIVVAVVARVVLIVVLRAIEDTSRLMLLARA